MDELLRLLPLLIAALVIPLGMLVMTARFYQVVPAGKAIARTGVGGLKVVTEHGIIAVPIMHRVHHIHTEAEAFTATLDGQRQEIVVEANLTLDDLKYAFLAFGDKDRHATREVLQVLIDSSATAAELKSRLADVGYRRI